MRSSISDKQCLPACYWFTEFSRWCSLAHYKVPSKEKRRRLAGKYLSLDLLTIFNFISPGTSLISINDLAVFNLYMFFLSPFNTSFRPIKRG